MRISYFCFLIFRSNLKASKHQSNGMFSSIFSSFVDSFGIKLIGVEFNVTFIDICAISEVYFTFHDEKFLNDSFLFELVLDQFTLILLSKSSVRQYYSSLQMHMLKHYLLKALFLHCLFPITPPTQKSNVHFINSTFSTVFFPIYVTFCFRFIFRSFFLSMQFNDSSDYCSVCFVSFKSTTFVFFSFIETLFQKCHLML